MTRRGDLLGVLSVLFVIALAALGSAHTPGQSAPAAASRWLASPIHEEPSPAVTWLEGVGTAKAVAEARMTPQVLLTHCEQHAHLHASVAACLARLQSEYSNKTFRASADCTVGRITTTAEQTYTLDGLWEATDGDDGRTRWRDAQSDIVGRDLANNGLHISQQWETLCPAPVTPALIERAAKARAARRQPMALRRP